MSFLSRKPARPSGRDGNAGRDDEYDDYDGYAHDAYQNEDDGWSPNEYFSPEGIKGRWAGQHPEGRAGGRGQGDAVPDYNDDYSGTEYGGSEYGGAPGYGADEFATGVYDLPEGADGDRSDRGRRRRRDREDRGERTGILRLRRDRGEDIWPDDGISDEDYWASVAADRPLNGADSPLDNFPAAPGGPGPRPGADGRPGMGGADSARFGGDQRGAERGGAGRLGPPPGLGGDYQPAAGNSGPMRVGAGVGQPGGGRASSGPMPARPGTGPQPARPVTGPTPTVGVTSSRPPAGQNGVRPGPAKPGPGANGFPQPAARPSFQPNGYQPAGYQAGGTAGTPAVARPQDRGDWGDRTERIDRVNAAGYPDQRPTGRSQGPGAPSASGPLGRAAGYQAAPTGTPSFTASPGRGRADHGRPENGRQDNARVDNAAWQAPARREADRRDHGRDGGRDVNGRETSGGWPAQARGGKPAMGGAEDDPLTSKAFARSAQSDTDGRSYRAAARRSQAQTKLTEQAETFITGQYQQSSQYQSGRTGEYWYRDDAPTTISQAAAARYPAAAGQGASGHDPGPQRLASHGGHAAQPARGQASPAHGLPPAHGGQPTHGGQPGMAGHNGSRAAGAPPSPGLPGAGLPGGHYEAQQARPAQPQRPPQHRQPQPQLPSAALPAANPSAAVAPNGAYPGGGASGGSPAGAGAGQSGSRSTGAGGQNPYDSGVTGSYPYANQTYNGRAATSGPTPATDDRYYRPAPADRYGQGGADQGGAAQNGGGRGAAGQGRADQGRNGYGYPANGERRH